MTRAKTSLALVGAGLLLGGGWMAAQQTRHPSAEEVAQRACIEDVANHSAEAEDSGALAAQAAECSVQDL
ncbi:hypothetical protein [Sphingomonas morindae]|uniref:Secreted protein n=1 Tax=Sphingomonas morindae TaxID=1541170 RepID=A0ABY4X9Z5_9SPHN|nr:hypothetical protein [Sphingomonas morindae]USI73783.1 hypothetical protein LHA26_04760 [Sphingomonas morindae]